MNLVNLFGNTKKTQEPEYYLAIEIHESLIKTALWEILEDTPSVINIGSYESWTDEDTLIRGVETSLEQAVNVIDSVPRKAILGLPDTWIEGGRIHPSKTKLIGRLLKELDFNPLGMVPINSAIAHYMKKLEGIPPTAILLEIYNTKVAVSIIEKGEIVASEEAARSGDIAQDVEEGLTVIGRDKLPSRFILTNGTNLEEEEQRITSHPWQERLSFQHLPKVEVLPIDFSIRSVALAGGAEALRYLQGEPIAIPEDSSDSEQPNITLPDATPPSLSELGFEYEEAPAPSSIPPQEETEYVPPIGADQSQDATPQYAFPQETSTPLHHYENSEKQSFKPQLFIPKLPKFSLPTLPPIKGKLIYLLALPLILLALSLYYFLAGQADITIYFTPQKITKQVPIIISQSQIEGTATLLASPKTVSGQAQEKIETTGETTVGDKASGTITIANKSTSPIVLKTGAQILSDNGKYAYLIQESVTIASKSADPLTFQETYGKATQVKVVAQKIGAEYNLSKNTQFSVDNYSKNVAYALADNDFAGGTSRVVRAVSKADQDKLFQIASEKIKQQVQESLKTTDSQTGSVVVSDLTFTKKVFDKNVAEEASEVSLNLEGSIDLLVYNQSSLYEIAKTSLAPQIPPGNEIFEGNTDLVLEEPVKTASGYQSNLNITARLFPQINQEKYMSFIRFKQASSIRPFFTSIQGFQNLNIKIKPLLPIFSSIIPRTITFSLVEKQ